MSKKLSQWLSVVVAESKHSTNASQADCARILAGRKGSVAEKHLARIADREQLLSEWFGIVANSPALNDDEEG